MSPTHEHGTPDPVDATLNHRERSSERPTTTHSAWGSGNPRLVFNVGDTWDGRDAREFRLTAATTTIGSADTADLVLPGLDPLHARIVHDDDDEYVLECTGPAELSLGSRADDRASQRHVLRTGSRVKLGEWSLFFSRLEVADHGRPYGGRAGGEGAHQRPQEPRPDYAGHDAPPE